MSRRQLSGDPSDPQGMVALMEQFCQWMAVRNYSESTIQSKREHLGYFIEWAAARGITRPAEITKPIIEHYQRYLFQYRKSNGKPLTFESQTRRVVAIRTWFRWLARNNHVLYNPAADIDLPRLGRKLPKHVLTASEAEQVINKPNVADRLGLRDRAILETFYSTGMRRRELMQLHPSDLDMDRGTVAIRQGKGKKDRIVPIGARALVWIMRYQTEVRPGLLIGDRAGDVLFLTHLGKPFRPNQMSQLVRDYVVSADIGKLGSCHLFRHTMATLMLENGAGIRYIQAILGHASLETTQIYTRVSIRKLKEVHTATHPAHPKRTA